MEGAVGVEEMVEWGMWARFVVVTAHSFPAPLFPSSQLIDSWHTTVVRAGSLTKCCVQAQYLRSKTISFYPTFGIYSSREDSTSVIRSIDTVSVRDDLERTSITISRVQ